MDRSGLDGRHRRRLGRCAGGGRTDDADNAVVGCSGPAGVVTASVVTAKVVLAGTVITSVIITSVIITGIALPAAMGGSTRRDRSSREFAAAGRDWLRTQRGRRFGAAVVEWSTRKFDVGLGGRFGSGDISAAGPARSAPGRAWPAPGRAWSAPGRAWSAPR